MYENKEIPGYVRYTLNKMENTYEGEASKNQKIKILNKSQDKILIQFNPRLYDEIKKENQRNITEYQQKIEESKQKKEKSKKQSSTIMKELTDIVVHNNNAASPPSSRSNSSGKTRSKGGGKKNRKTRKRAKKSN
jgi:hypothetical protein